MERAAGSECMIIHRTAYPACEITVEWLSEHFVPIEENMFFYWKELKHLIRIVDEAERHPESMGRRLAARDAISQYNRRHDSQVEYADVRNRDARCLYDCCTWMCFVKSREDQEMILRSRHKDPELAFYEADPSVKWVVILAEDEILVYRSPHTARRAAQEETLWMGEDCYCTGLRKGNELCYVLPAEEEAGILQELERGYEHETLQVDVEERGEGARA